MHDIANKEGVICLSLRNQLIIDIKYVNKLTNNMYINKQTAVKAGFNPNSIEKGSPPRAIPGQKGRH